MLSDIRTCEPGDVLMVSMQNTDKKTGKPYTWRFFAIVAKVMGRSIGVLRVGAKEEDGYMVLDHRSVRRVRVMLLDDSEWPDGIWQIRTKLILLGKIELSE